MDITADFGDVKVRGRNLRNSTAGVYTSAGVPIRVYADCGDIEVK